eukprot:g8572.t1
MLKAAGGLGKVGKAAGGLPGLYEKGKTMKDFYDSEGVLPEKTRAMVKSTLDRAGSAVKHLGHRHHHQHQNGTNALRALGLAVIGKDGKHIAPASRHRSNPSSRAEMMEGIVYTIKQAYSGRQVNVATWDAGLTLDSMKCYGLVEFGIAQSGNGLEYAFAVFLGAGEIKWRGGLRAGVPDVSCAGNINMGPDAIWFGNTDASPHNDVSDVVALMSR